MTFNVGRASPFLRGANATCTLTPIYSQVQASIILLSILWITTNDHTSG